MDSLSTFNNFPNPKNEELIAVARKMATHLLSRLYPISPLVSSQTKNEHDALAWINAWAIQIVSNRLQPSEIDSGLSRIGELMRSRNAPFSLALFLEACRPQNDLLGHDFESRQIDKRLSIKEDFLKKESWVKKRNDACKALRKMGYKQVVVPKEEN